MEEQDRKTLVTDTNFVCFCLFLSTAVQVSLMVSQRHLGPRQGAGVVVDVSWCPGSKDS